MATPTGTFECFSGQPAVKLKQKPLLATLRATLHPLALSHQRDDQTRSELDIFWSLLDFDYLLTAIFRKKDS